ncbi:hypothetical protein J3R83DRAFT_7129 [Lanmaoa asiatica]|nr:hypothetical protein J3R83DRAFT_7129 [Lanmaoa asiatica]
MAPATTYDQESPIANGSCRDSIVAGRPAPPRSELHSVNLASWDDGDWADPIFSETHPDELDEPWPYRFKSGESVWICASDGEWYRGKVVGQAKQGKTRSDDGLFWCVEFRVVRSRVRKWFAPLNGDIKPDTQHTHQLLSDAGWLESDSDE